MNKVPFMVIPNNYDPQTWMVFNRMALYIKAMESALMQQGILTFGEVEKQAKRGEALQAIEGIEEQLQGTKNAIENMMNPLQQQEAKVKWECSDEKSALESALNQYKQQLAETFSD